MLKIRFPEPEWPAVASCRRVHHCQNSGRPAPRHRRPHPHAQALGPQRVPPPRRRVWIHPGPTWGPAGGAGGGPGAGGRVVGGAAGGGPAGSWVGYGRGGWASPDDAGGDAEAAEGIAGGDGGAGEGGVED
jgi:hypothetical protein